jgi:hypothetical protein
MRPSGKRKRPRYDEPIVDEDGPKENDRWRVSDNGKEMSKRVGNTLVGKAIEVSESGTLASTE